MPELPEVETVRIGLSKFIIGKKIQSYSFDWPKSFPNSNTDADHYLKSAMIVGIRRRAKVLLIDLDTKYTVMIHLKMTGQLVYKSDLDRFGAGHPSDSLIHELPDSSTRVVLHFEDNSQLFFNDQRKFGWMRLIPTTMVDEVSFIKKLGPEPLESNFTFPDFQKRLLRRSRSSIKAVLLDQTIIAGIGNIYADESLWAAHIHPSRIVQDISTLEIKNLLKEIRLILELAIEKGGSTDRNYVNAEGKKGSYLQIARVFRREGQACPRCQTTIQKIRVAGRGTHICPYCQKK